MVDHLLYMCEDKIKKMHQTCRQVEYSSLPDDYLIYYVKGTKRKGIYRAKQRLRAWRATDGELYEIPVDAKPVERPQDELFYRETYAEFGICRLSKKAFINIYFGKDFAIGFEYDFEIHGTGFVVGNEQTVWTK